MNTNEVTVRIIKVEPYFSVTKVIIVRIRVSERFKEEHKMAYEEKIAKCGEDVMDRETRYVEKE